MADGPRTLLDGCRPVAPLAVLAAFQAGSLHDAAAWPRRGLKRETMMSTAEKKRRTWWADVPIAAGIVVGVLLWYSPVFQHAGHQHKVTAFAIIGVGVIAAMVLLKLVDRAAHGGGQSQSQARQRRPAGSR
jgi:hypothetical protein